MRKTLHRLLRIAPLALLFVASVASAQTTGSIIGVVTDHQSGKPVVGALVVATSPNLQGEQTAVTDKTGQFRFQLLPPGAYKLAASFDGFKPSDRDVTVNVDKTIRANLSLVPEAVQMEEQLVKTGAAPVINVGNSETGAVVSKEFTSNIPGTRNFESVAIVAPGATFDTYGVSFAGASSPENGYILDGMNVTDPSYGTNGVALNTNFIQELDIKTGSFMPEYGRATGGIINVVTKSGSNEFHGSVFANYTPGQLSSDPKAVGRNGEALGLRSLPHDGSYRADFGFEVGGPILKDRLWFYVGFAPQIVRTQQERFLSVIQEDGTSGSALTDSNGIAVGVEDPAFSRKFMSKTDSFQLVSKLTYLFNENNNVSVSYITVPGTSQALASANGDPSSRYAKSENDFSDLIAHFTSKMMDKKLVLDIMGGWHHSYYADKPEVVDGVDQAATKGVSWRQGPNYLPSDGVDSSTPLTTFQDVPGSCAQTASGFQPCAVTNYTTGGLGYIQRETIDRYAGKAALTYLANGAGSHILKAGIDLESNTYDHWKTYTGGSYMYQRYAKAPNQTLYPGFVPPVNGFTGYGNYFQDYRQYGVVQPDLQSVSGDGTSQITSKSTSNAFYAQDSWSPNFVDGLTFNIGIRWETQSMSASIPGSQSLSINDNVGPRLQAIYDWTGQGRSKVYANWGRFYESIPLDMGDRAFGDERQARDYRAYCVGARPAGGSMAGQPDQCQVLEGFYSTVDQYSAGTTVTYQSVGSGSTPVSPTLKGQYVDHFGAGVEYEVLPDISLGVAYAGRRLGRVIEDMSNDDGVNYAIANPGEGKPFLLPDGQTYFDPINAQSTDAVTGRTYPTKFPKPVREYDGVTFSATKVFSNHWQALASYTYSSFRGNYPGLFRAENGQLDPNITSEYDLVSLLSNKNGPLPGDVPHQLKLYGSYGWDLNQKMAITAGAGVRSQSGTPINYLGAHPDYGPTEAFILGRGSAGRTPFVSTVDLKGIFEYKINPPYALKFSVDLFNVLNSQQMTSVDQNYTFDSVQPIIGGQCNKRNGAQGSSPLTTAVADCPDLAYLKTIDGSPATPNKNYGRATAYQAPFTVRFGLEFAF